MTELDIRKDIESGNGWWNHETLEYVFYDEQFDEDGHAGCPSFGISKLDMSKYGGDLLDCYQSCNDVDIDRDVAARRIADEYGWIRVDDHITKLYAQMLAEAELVTQDDESDAPLPLVYKVEYDTSDFISIVWGCNDDTKEWNEFLESVASYAAEPSQSGSPFTKFNEFMYEHGYNDKISDVLYDAMEAFVNERIMKTGADFDFC